MSHINRASERWKVKSPLEESIYRSTKEDPRSEYCNSTATAATVLSASQMCTVREPQKYHSDPFPCFEKSRLQYLRLHNITVHKIVCTAMAWGTWFVNHGRPPHQRPSQPTCDLSLLVGLGKYHSGSERSDDITIWSAIASMPYLVDQQHHDTDRDCDYEHDCFLSRVIIAFSTSTLFPRKETNLHVRPTSTVGLRSYSIAENATFADGLHYDQSGDVSMPASSRAIDIIMEMIYGMDSPHLYPDIAYRPESGIIVSG
ncbi:hypothetical protein AC579_9544 [Pseudocercospora musae]|uniref:Uncharacterized protein n=1 Tax=Pseudocercospora musae TaxID=113226 RepID=A0A139HE13_9PEZI|nr:hypothetical protein AC579_9544 [Pseudocercospora musae]